MFKMLFGISTIFLWNNFLSNDNNLENSLKFQPNSSLVLLIKVLLIKQKACIQTLPVKKKKLRNVKSSISYHLFIISLFTVGLQGSILYKYKLNFE